MRWCDHFWRLLINFRYLDRKTSRISRLLARGRRHLLPDREIESRRRGICSSVSDARSRRSLTGGALVEYRSKSSKISPKLDDFEQSKDGPKIVMIVIFLEGDEKRHCTSKLWAPPLAFLEVFCWRGRWRMAPCLYGFLFTNHVLIANHVFKIVTFIMSQI